MSYGSLTTYGIPSALVSGGFQDWQETINGPLLDTGCLQLDIHGQASIEDYYATEFNRLADSQLELPPLFDDSDSISSGLLPSDISVEGGFTIPDITADSLAFGCPLGADTLGVGVTAQLSASAPSSLPVPVSAPPQSASPNHPQLLSPIPLPITLSPCPSSPCLLAMDMHQETGDERSPPRDPSSGKVAKKRGARNVVLYPSPVPSLTPDLSPSSDTSSSLPPSPSPVTPLSVSGSPLRLGKLTETPRRNKQVDLSSSPPPSPSSSDPACDPKRCPHCGFIPADRSKAQLKRHFDTHYLGEWACWGVPLRLAAEYGLTDEQLRDMEEQGRVLWCGNELTYGGCGQTFSRRDACSRHLGKTGKKRGCVGSAGGDWQLGNIRKRAKLGAGTSHPE